MHLRACAACVDPTPRRACLVTVEVICEGNPRQRACLSAMPYAVAARA